MSKSEVFAILGMHRSGTSMLAGSLEQAGIYLGEVNKYNDHNKKGSKESSFLMQLHEEVLVDNKGSWHSPPYKSFWSPYRKKILEFYIQSFEGQEKWGFKDPRTLLNLKVWNELIPDLKKVGIFRNPNAVAISLKKRNNFPLQHGLDLWVRYNRQLLKEYNRSPFPIIEFSSDEKIMDQQMNALSSHLQLELTKLDFYSTALISSEADVNLKGEVFRLYNKLKSKTLK